MRYLRVGLQTVAALAAASFYNLAHPAIQPANVIIVPGKIAEGGWPFVKLTQFALAGFKSAPGQVGPDLTESDFASPEQLLDGKVDFRSEIYSVGATMCFLLTGVFYSAHPRWPQTKRFPRPLRHLIRQTLEDDPEARPQDPVLFAEELRKCLVKLERRLAWERRLGIPLVAVVQRSGRRVVVREPVGNLAGPKTLLATPSPPAAAPFPPTKSRPFPRQRWAIAAALLGLLILGTMLLPEDVVTAVLHRKRPIQMVGVPIGVPQPGPAVAQKTSVAPGSGSGSPMATGANISPAPAGDVAANDTNTSPAATQAVAAGSPIGSERSNTEPTRLAAASPASPPPVPPAEGPDNSSSVPRAELAEGAPLSADQKAETAESSSASDSNRAASSNPATAADEETKHAGKVAKGSSPHAKRTRVAAANSHSTRSRSIHRRRMRARVVGTTPGGNLILRLPTGELAFVPRGPVYPDGYPGLPPRRVIIQRRTAVMPPPPMFLPPD